MLDLTILSLKNKPFRKRFPKLTKPKNFNFERFISIKTELLKQLYLSGLSLKNHHLLNLQNRKSLNI